MVQKKGFLLCFVATMALVLSACSGGQSSTRGAAETRVMAAACLPIQTAYNGWLIHGEFSTSALGAQSLTQLENAANLAWLTASDFDNDVGSREKRPRNDAPPYRIQDFYAAALALSAYASSAKGLEAPVVAGKGTLESRYQGVAVICEDVR